MGNWLADSLYNRFRTLNSHSRSSFSKREAVREIYEFSGGVRHWDAFRLNTLLSHTTGRVFSLLQILYMKLKIFTVIAIINPIIAIIMCSSFNRHHN